MTTITKHHHTASGHPEPSDAGPSLRAVPFGGGVKDVRRLLSARQRSDLLSIATQLHLTSRMILYREGSGAEWIYIVATGVVKAFRDLPSGKRRVAAFLFADDVFGLAEGGHYVNSVQTITPVTLYRMRTDALTDTIRRDADLGFQFLCKLTHELRAAQRQTVIVARRDAAGRLAMFLRMLEQRAHTQRNVIDIPMSRSDMANYLGLSLEAVSRACRLLERSGIVSFTGRHTAHILNRSQFDKLAARV